MFEEEDVSFAVGSFSSFSVVLDPSAGFSEALSAGSTGFSLLDTDESVLDSPSFSCSSIDSSGRGFHFVSVFFSGFLPSHLQW